MKTNKLLTLTFLTTLLMAADLNAQIGYYNAPYTRYEADLGTLANGAAATAKTHDQWSLQSEASEQVCVNLPNTNSSVQWTVTADGDGLVVRYSVPDGQTGTLEIYANGTYVADLVLTTYYSWESLWNNGNPNNAGVTNQAPKMRFDEVRYKLPSKILAGGTLRLQRKSGSGGIHLDFAELEPVPAATPSTGSVYTGNGSDLQTFINNNDGGGNTIFLPPGVYNVNSQIYFDADNTTLRGAGVWYTQIHFTNGSANQGGLRSNANNISFAGLYLTTVRNSRSNSYKAINGAFTNGATISNVWAEHFECGAWIAQYSSGPSPTNGLTVSHCRFRNNYADGINLCKGTRNTIVEYCSFRNNGDDDMAMWSADGQECQNNTFRYNTSENCWRASGVAIYGGYNNKAQNILIQDNIEVGIKVNNAFNGVGFNAGGMHEFTNILIKRCGTFYDLFNRNVGAIDLGVYNNGAGTQVRNVKFSCITIIDSKNDAIYINKSAGDGFYNVVFENITIDGTGKEYPSNGGAVGNRGHMVLFNGSPNGNMTYCSMTYSNRGGSATVDVNTTNKGSLSWTSVTGCSGGCVQTSTVTVTSASTFGVCNNPVTLTATTTPPAGNTVSYIEFFVNGTSIGTDNSSPYNGTWNNPPIGTRQITAVAHYSGGSTATSPIQNVTVADGIYSTGSAPTIDGTIEGLWSGYAPFTVNTVAIGTISGAADLSATYRITRDATNLYIVADVTDDALRNESANHWEDDAIEIFIDMGNDKAVSYGANDFSYTFGVNDATVYESQHNATGGVVFAQGAKAGGYIMEIRIPWATLGGAPAAGAFMGFDLHINDDDDNGTRDAKIVWKDATDNAWQWPSVLGTLQIANCTNPLPVEWLMLTAETSGEHVILNWSTIQEDNNDKFIIERSADLANWESIGTVKGAGNSSSLINYSFTDYNPSGMILYYRIQQIDFDEAASYSEVVAVTFNNVYVSIAPNPFENDLSVMTNVRGNILISIYDVTGKLMYQSDTRNESGVMNIQPNLPAGSYIISIRTETMLEQQKLVRQ